MSTASRYRQIDDLFRAALRLKPEERAGFLTERCGDDDQLKSEVLALLDEDLAAGGALDQPALGAGMPLDLRNFTDAIRPAPAAPLPERIGRYRILRIIGEGGMGIVYEAEQDDPRRRVALKVIRSGSVSRQLLQRFRHEAQVLGQLTHPGIAQIYEAGTADAGMGGQPFFAMELINGRPLLEFADEHQLDARDRLALMASICDALQHAHQRGVIHRDLKPGNILVVNESSQSPAVAVRGGSNAQPKILDFGVARATDADIQTVTLQTDAGQLIGTVPYMSPEQAAGDSSAIDTRSDVYSLGVILYELLTGRLPHDLRGKLIHEAVRIIREDEHSSLSSINRVFRGDVDTILCKALEKEKERRYQSASELAADIRRYLSDEPIAARPATTLYQIRKFARRNRKLVIGVSAGLAVAFAAMTVATVISWRQMRVASNAKALADERNVQVERNAYRATIAAAAASLAQDDALSARRFLDTAPESLRNWEWRYLESQLDQSTLLLKHGQAEFVEFLATDDLDRITTLSGDGRIDAWNLRTFERTPIAQLDTQQIFLCVGSREAERLAILDGDRTSPSRRLVSVDAASGRIIAQTTVGSINALAASSDGRRVVAQNWSRATLWRPDADEQPIELINSTLHAPIAVTDDGRAVVIDRARICLFNADGSGSNTIGEVPQATVCLEVTSDGSRIIAGDVFGTVRVFDAGAGSAPSRVIKAHAGYTQRLCFLDNGQRFASGGGPGDSTIRIWNTDTGALQAVLLGCVNGVIKLEPSSDGRSIIAIDRQGDLRTWKLDDADSTNVLRGHTNYAYDVRFTREGSRVISSSWDRTIRIWNAHTGECLNILKGEKQYITAMDVSPDGKMIATGNQQGYWGESQVRLWDAESGTMLAELTGSRSQLTSVAFSPDGTKLAATAVLSGVHAWDIRSPASPMEIGAARNPRREPWQVAWSPNSKALAVCYADGVAIVADPIAGQELRQWQAHERAANFLDYSPDGSQIVTVCGDATVKLWNATTGALIHTLVGHRDIGWCAAFSPDGSRLATGSKDNTIRIWDVVSGQHLLELRGHNDYVHSVKFSPDGSMLASCAGDGTVRIWDTSPASERWRARNQMLRSPTQLDESGAQ